MLKLPQYRTMGSIGLACVLVLPGVTGCAPGTAWRASEPPAPVATPAPAPLQAAPAPATAAPVVTPPAPPAPPVTSATTRPAPETPAQGSVAGQARSFSTQHATYTAVPFESIPGWGQDDFLESWAAFQSSCRTLARRGKEWRTLCERSERVDRKSSASIRGFYEREFSAYQIRDDDRRSNGVVTGYFEPEIEGSRKYAPPFIYPVYGQPQDMLYLDTRRIPARASGTVAARVEGRNVSIQSGLSTRDLGAGGVYALDLEGITRGTLDRRARLRVDGNRLLPYYTRGEIETRGAPNAPVIAFVSSATALYEMQIQGSGRIRLPDGELIRVGYAEQNGHPFRPTLAQASGGRKGKGVRVRGSFIELELDEEEDEEAANAGVLTRGFTLARPARSGAVVVPGQRAQGPVTGSGITDPSYVFFKETQLGQGAGAVGALGVPLTAGRSIAVDPRSTPLGYPVFVSTREPSTRAPMQKLTFAQDTGGAIRGAVRADYFFGAGTQAASQARRMKQPGQMWIFLPKGLNVAAAARTGIRTRGAGIELADCLVPDDSTCVEDEAEP